jgi:dTMP kinase
MRGRFITLEGGEGTGKSTQARLLAQRLEGLGHSVLVTREPGGSPGAEIIRHVLLAGAAQPLGPDAEAMLFAAARDDHVQSTIAPALTAGRWVISDRFADSTRVYQGVLGQVDQRMVRALERIAVGTMRPDLTLVLDLAPEAGLARAARRRGGGAVDRFEHEKLQFHVRLRDAYRELAATEPDRCVLVDASGSPEGVAVVIWKACSERLGLTGAAAAVPAAVAS